MSTHAKSGSDTGAAFMGLILGGAFIGAIMYGIVILTNQHFAKEAAEHGGAKAAEVR